MRHVFLGFFYALLAAAGFSLLGSFVLCWGMDPERRIVSDMVAPLFGIFAGGYLASRTPSWKAGLYVSFVYVILWVEFWMYIIGRLNPLSWLEEGLPQITLTHLAWWGAGILAGGLGGLFSKTRFGSLLMILTLCVGFVGLILFLPGQDIVVSGAATKDIPGYYVEREGPLPDGTVVYFLTFDFQKQSPFTVGLYDRDSDDPKPYDNFNTSYLGQSLTALVAKLSARAETHHHQLLCAINGGFFGATGLSVAHHEEPIVQDGRVLYDVDLLKPKEQAWFLAVNSALLVKLGEPRFTMVPSISKDELGKYQTVLGGVRPLRVKGNSLPLKPGAGSTSLRCSRTSVGWSADGNKLYVLVVHDPDGEAASQIQRKLNQNQTGGWDVSEVQKFWEKKQVPFALLFDGGESTQLAFRKPDGNFHYLFSGYEYSFTVGYLSQRPLLINPPILPPSEARRGVLNYLYVEGPADKKN